MGYSAEQSPAVPNEDRYSAAAQLAVEARRTGRPDIYGIFLCKRIGDGIEASSGFEPIADYKDENGKVHTYNSPGRHFMAYTPGSGYMVDARFSAEYAAGDPETAFVQVASANLAHDVRDPIQNWEVMGLSSRLGRMTVMLQAHAAPELHVAKMGERRRPRRGLSSELRGYLGEEVTKAYAEIIFDSERGVLWVPPEGGIYQLRSANGLITEFNQLSTEQETAAHGGHTAQIIPFPQPQAA